MARSTLADANEERDWRIHAQFAQHLIRIGLRRIRFKSDEGKTLVSIDR